MPIRYSEDCNCGHEMCTGEKFMQVDPYRAELFADYKDYLMCSGEAYERRMDV